MSNQANTRGLSSKKKIVQFRSANIAEDLEAMNQDKGEETDPDLRQSLSRENEESDSALTTWFDGHVVGSTHLVYAQVIKAQVFQAYPIKARVVEAQGYTAQVLEAQDYAAQAVVAQNNEAQVVGPQVTEAQIVEAQVLEAQIVDPQVNEAQSFEAQEHQIIIEREVQDPVIVGEVNMIADADLMNDEDEDPSNTGQTIGGSFYAATDQSSSLITGTLSHAPGRSPASGS